MFSNSKVWKDVVWYNPYPCQTVSLVLRKNIRKIILCQNAPCISEFSFISVTRLSHIIWRNFKRSFIHRLELGLVNISIYPIRLRCFATLNVMHLRRSVHDVVDLKWCSKWAANESYFCPFLEDVGHWRNDIHNFLKYLPIVTYMNIVKYGEFYFVG